MAALPTFVVSRGACLFGGVADFFGVIGSGMMEPALVRGRIGDEKDAVRRRLLAWRLRRAADDDGAAGQELARCFFETAAALSGAVAAGAVVAGYWPIRGEIDVRPLLGGLKERGMAGALPAMTEKGAALTFRLWSEGEPLEPGPCGTRHPAGDAAEVVPDVVLTPLTAFDRRGGRLGYGGGCYDRTLAALRGAGNSVLVVGVAYAGQEVERLPVEEHDQRLDWVATEQGMFRAEVVRTE